MIPQGCTVKLKNPIIIPSLPPAPEGIKIRHTSLRIGKFDQLGWDSGWDIGQYHNNVCDNAKFERLCYQVPLSEVDILSIFDGIYYYYPKQKILEGIAGLTVGISAGDEISSLDCTMYEEIRQYELVSELSKEMSILIESGATIVI